VSPVKREQKTLESDKVLQTEGRKYQRGGVATPLFIKRYACKIQAAKLSEGGRSLKPDEGQDAKRRTIVGLHPPSRLGARRGGGTLVRGHGDRGEVALGKREETHWS